MTPEERGRREVLLAARKIASGDWALTPGIWKRAEVELKAARSSSAAAVKNAMVDLLRATKATDLQAALVHVHEALATLRGMVAEETGEEAVKATLASLSRHQVDQEIHIGLRESQLKAFLTRPSPPPSEPKGKAAEGERATAFVDKETRGSEDIATSRLRRRLNTELRRAKRG